MTTLLEKARARGRNRKRFPPTLSSEQWELVWAYLDGELTTIQVSYALGGKVHDSNGAYRLLARALRELYATEKILHI